MKKTPLPNGKDLDKMLYIYKQSLIAGWSNEYAQRRAGITQRLDIFLSTSCKEYLEIKNKYHNRKPGKHCWSYNDHIIKIEQEKREVKKEKERLEALLSTSLPFGLKNINQD